MECDDLRTELLEHGIEVESEINEESILWLKPKKKSKFSIFFTTWFSFRLLLTHREKKEAGTTRVYKSSKKKEQYFLWRIV